MNDSKHPDRKLHQIKTLSWIILFFGLVLLFGGLFSQSAVTPLATMDCGCGGAQACVTKASIVNLGTILIASGILCLSMSTVSLIFSALRLRPA